MHRKLLLGAAIAALTFAGAASAAVVDVSNVGVTSNDSSFDHLNLTQLVSSADASADVWAPGILFTDTVVGSGVTKTQLVFCVDLEHVIYVEGYSDPLVFDTGFVTQTGGGATISEATSNEIGQLANIGQAIYAAHGADYAVYLTAVQGAIWSLEYGVGGQRATSSNATVDAEIVHLLSITKDNGKGYANGLLADPHAEQNMVTGLVPEPASWALMIGGFGMAGAMLRRQRRSAATA